MLNPRELLLTETVKIMFKKPSPPNAMVVLQGEEPILWCILKEVNVYFENGANINDIFIPKKSHPLNSPDSSIT